MSREGTLAAFVLVAGLAAFVLLLSPDMHGLLAAAALFTVWLACAAWSVVQRRGAS